MEWGQAAACLSRVTGRSFNPSEAAELLDSPMIRERRAERGEEWWRKPFEYVQEHIRLLHEGTQSTLRRFDEQDFIDEQMLLHGLDARDRAYEVRPEIPPLPPLTSHPHVPVSRAGAGRPTCTDVSQALSLPMGTVNSGTASARA